MYCLVNLLNGHIYIGSSINLAIRMKNYLNNNFLNQKKNHNMPITKALLKYKQDNFALLIIEFVPQEKIQDLAVKETYYITKYLPYYNVAFSSTAFSSTGFKHTEETKKLYPQD